MQKSIIEKVHPVCNSKKPRFDLADIQLKKKLIKESAFVMCYRYLYCICMCWSFERYKKYYNHEWFLENLP